MKAPKEAYEKFSKVPAEILAAWFTRNFSDIEPEEYAQIEPEFFYTVSTPALPGDNPLEISKGRFAVGDFWEIGEAEGAAQTLYFQNREARITLCEASE